MKKLLNLLSLLVLGTSFSSTVVSCNKNNDSRVADPSISDKIKNEINISIKGFNQVAGMNTDDIWKSSKSDIDNLILNILQENVGKDFYKKVMEKRAQDLGQTTTSTELDKSFSDYIKELTLNNLYQTYTQDYNNGDYLERKIFNDNGINTDIQSSDWYVSGTNSRFFAKTDNTVDTWHEDFNWDDTTHAHKVDWSENVDQSTLPTTSNFDEWNSLFDSNDLVKIKKQLGTRFRTYIDNYLKPQMFKTALVNSYLQSGSFSFYNQDKKSLIKEYSPLFNTWQSWNSNEWYSNMKMVWEVRVDKADQFLANSSLLNTMTDGLRKAKDIGAFEKVFNDNKTALDTYGLKFGGDNTLGYDSIWSQNGYEGMYGISPSNNDETKPGTIFTQDNASNSDIEPYKNQLTTNQDTYSPGAIDGADGTGASVPYFVDSSKNQVVFAFDLPIYLMDLINGVKGDANTHGISYTPYDSVDKTANKVKNPISRFNTEYDGSSSKESDLGNKWNNDMSDRSSTDVDGLNIEDGVNRSQELFNLVESKIATSGSSSDGSDSGIALTADQTLYTWAFDGNPNNVYSDDLFSKIGKYIEDYDD